MFIVAELLALKVISGHHQIIRVSQQSWCTLAGVSKDVYCFTGILITVLNHDTDILLYQENSQGILCHY